MNKSTSAAVVTGGASGIGLAIAHHLVSEGMAVVAVDRNSESCTQARKILSQFGDRVRVVKADIATEEGAALTIGRAVDSFGRLDLLCNNAAYHPLELIEEHSLDTWRECFRVNVDGTMLCCRAALPVMKRQGGGTIVNIGSVSGISPYPTGAAYAASKAAVAMLTRALALEVGAFSITVNCIAPGSIRHRPDDDPRAPAPNVPVGRHGRVEDVAAMVSYLASPAARYITGTSIVLDGGATAGRSRAEPKTARN